ncbi:hypothetical protein TCAL_09565 [Tigriopus californicus]|uniref:WSC domain-containing protein n=1 Tax=Tigriopus californicus TaxID=6832 RepID=A0A553PTF7_TIGCA|nr:uncharacterized protein LOC131891747 isoform X2 [Tigriopus californicus]TRY80957.1 hypothetical protein TCAL_09565 [Tigriopus californicus]|eukprot:TCALIF_09565-PA protein Name:"Protein of unknown function" AED:0.00 eAED:0.00 QI:46/1/1/1/1/1/3/68/216
MHTLLFVLVLGSGICFTWAWDHQDIPPLTCYRKHYSCQYNGRPNFITAAGTSCPKRCALIKRKTYKHFTYNAITHQCYCHNGCTPKYNGHGVMYVGLVSMERDSRDFLCGEDKQNQWYRRIHLAARIPSPGPGCKYRFGVTCNSRDFKYSRSIGKDLTLEYCKGTCLSHPKPRYSEYDERTGYCYCFPSCENAKRGSIFNNLGVLYDDINNVCTIP